jgi:hypothetical protein
MIPFVAVVKVVRTPTVPDGDRGAVSVMGTGGLVTGCDMGKPLRDVMVFCEVTHAFQVAADKFPTVKFMVRVPEA